jgi:hypothetical protein
MRSFFEWRANGEKGGKKWSSDVALNFNRPCTLLMYECTM